MHTHTIRGFVQVEALRNGRMCTVCSDWKDWLQFAPHKGGLQGRNSRCKDCCSAYQKTYMPKYYEAHGDKLRLRERQRNADDPVRGMWFASKLSARRRGLEHSLTREDIERAYAASGGVCPISKRPFESSNGRGREGMNDSPSLDRCDNTRGYHADNIWIISWRFNFIKSNATLEELCTLVDGLKNRPVTQRTEEGS